LAAGGRGFHLAHEQRYVSYLSEVENGHKEPCLRKIKELAQGLDVSRSRLMQGLWRLIASFSFDNHSTFSVCDICKEEEL
jgi:transcriptional regulator with XRE-family HTH domain